MLLSKAAVEIVVVKIQMIDPDDDCIKKNVVLLGGEKYKKKHVFNTT